MKLLVGHTSPESAHLSFGYPFGRTVFCVRREYVETNKNGSRFIAQTTDPAFNAEYTAKIEQDGSAAANAWAKTRIDAGTVAWNKPKLSTYELHLLLAEEPVAEDARIVTARPVHLSLKTSVDTLRALLDAGLPNDIRIADRNLIEWLIARHDDYL